MGKECAHEAIAINNLMLPTVCPPAAVLVYDYAQRATLWLWYCKLWGEYVVDYASLKVEATCCRGDVCYVDVT